jgi:hypothetical protein
MRIVAFLAAFVFVASFSFCRAESPAPAGKTLYHVVSFKYKPTATPEQIKEADAAFAALKTKIPGIVSLNWGDNVSPEKHDHGFTQCFVLTFATAKDRDGYLVHPEHKAFGKLLGPILADVSVLDFWAKE